MEGRPKGRGRKLAMAAAVPALGLAVAGAWLQTGAGGEFLARAASNAASGPGMAVAIGAIEHPLSPRVVARDVSVSDAAGEWLRIDRIEIEWSKLALLAGRVDIDAIDIGKIDFFRAPASPADAPKKQSAGGGGGVPDLPVSFHLGALTLGEIALDKRVAGFAASLAVKASADFSAHARGGALRLDVERLDAPGQIHIAANVPTDAAKSTVAVKIAEPAGGLIASLAKIPGNPAVAVDLAGVGAFDDFQATLTAAAGDDVGARGEARVTRQGASRHATFDIAGRVAPLLPAALRPLFEGETRIAGTGALDDKGAASLEKLSLAASALTFDAQGKLGGDGSIDATAAVRGVPAAAGAAFSANTLGADIHAAGTLSSPNIDARLLVENARSPAGRVGHIDATIKAVADGALGLAATRVDIAADVNGSGVAIADPGLAGAIGETATLSLRARATGQGDADISVAKLATSAGEASYSGRAGPNALDGRLTLAIPALARLSRLAGRDLRGAAQIAADLSGAPSEGKIEAKLSGGVNAPAVGVPALDALFGRRLSISGGVKAIAGGVAFDQLALVGEHARADIGGAADARTADIDAKIQIPDLSRADPRAAGRGDIDAAVTGSLSEPNAAFVVALSKATLAGRSVPRLELRGEARDLLGDMNAKAALDGLIDGKTARGGATIARSAGATKIDNLDIAIGRATIKGAASLDAAGLATGRVVVAAPDLDDFSALALQKLAGQFAADISLTAANGGQNIALVAQGAGIGGRDFAVGRLSAKLSAADALRRPGLDGDIAVDNARFGKETMSKVRLSAKPAGTGAALDLALDARGFAIAGHGVLTPGDATRLDLSSFTAQKGGSRVALAGPATISFGGGDIDIKGLAFAIGAGRVEISGKAGQRLDIQARARALPLSFAAIVDPSLGLEGTLDADARIEGSPAAPAGDWNVRVAKLVAAQTRSNAVPPIDATASGKLGGGRTTLDAAVALGATSKINIAGSAPIAGAGGLDLAITGALDASLANTMLAANGQTVRGKATVDLRLSGSPQAPIASGNVVFADGAFIDPLNGVAFDKIAARLEASGRELNVASFSAVAKNGGQVGLTGHVTLAPDSGFPGAFHLSARNAQLASTDIVSSTADLDIDIAGSLGTQPKITGKTTLLTMEVSVPDRLPANLKPIPGTTHIDAAGFAKQMLDLERKQREQRAKHAGKSKFNALFDLAVSAPNRIFVRGRGIDAEFGGDLKLTGSIDKPAAVGAFDLRRGTMQVATQRIDMTSGKLTFAGGLTPELDFVASTTAGDVTATVEVSGPANAPVFAFTSMPELPQDEVLSRLLFAKASGSLSPFQAVQLAAAVAQFSGVGGGVDAFEKMRKSLGVDSLDVQAGAGGPTVGASRYLTNNISVGVKTGAKPEDSSVNVGVDVTKRLRVQGETAADGKTSVGVGVEWEY